jgi:SAM-dependent methyltransferase
VDVFLRTIGYGAAMDGEAFAQLWRRLRYRLSRDKTFEFRGFAVDRWLANSTGAPPEQYARFAELHAALLARLAPVEPHHVVLEAGCGTGMDAMLLAGVLSSAGRYTGFDITAEPLARCAANLARFANFDFHHFDVRNETYNRRGALAATEVRFPAADGTVDRFIAQSLFTHLLPDVTAHYLRELRRVLRPDGLAMVSCFVGTRAEIAASKDCAAPMFRFLHQHAPGVFIHSRRRPSYSVAYQRETFDDLLAGAGLTIRTLLPGYWAAGRPATDIGQDIAVLTPAGAHEL